MNSVRLNNLSLKYKAFTSSGCKGLGISKFEFVAKNQFLRLYSCLKLQYTCFVNKNKEVIYVSSLAEMNKKIDEIERMKRKMKLNELNE